MSRRLLYVLGKKIEGELGFRAERGTTKAILGIWDGLEAGKFGVHPEENPIYFNIRWFKERCASLTEPTEVDLSRVV